MAIPGSQQSLNIIVTAATVGVGSAQCIAASNTRAGIMFANVHATNSIAICPTSFGAAALNTAGSVTLGPGAAVIFDTVTTRDAFNAIASGANTPLTIWEF